MAEFTEVLVHGASWRVRPGSIGEAMARYAAGHCTGCGAWLLAGHAAGCEVGAAELRRLQTQVLTVRRVGQLTPEDELDLVRWGSDAG
jgi:hypothetical protein